MSIVKQDPCNGIKIIVKITIRWIKNDQVDFKKLNLSSDTKKVQDLKGQYLLLFSNEWGVRWATDKNPDLVLAEFSQN